MPAMKKTLIQLVQDIAAAVDEEPVETLSDTLAAEQMAGILEEVFYDIVTYEQPEHMSFIKLEPASDNLFPTHLYYPDNTTDIQKVWYDQTEALVGIGEYQEVCYLDPLSFITRMDGLTPGDTNVQTVDDKIAGTKLLIQNDKKPEYYTTFDDYWIVFDSFNAAYDDTIQRSKTRAYARTYPVFDRFDEGYIPDIDAEYHQMMFHEAVTRFQDRYMGGVTQKQEINSRRSRYWVQDDKFRTAQPNAWSRYGRHG